MIDGLKNRTKGSIKHRLRQIRAGACKIDGNYDEAVRILEEYEREKWSDDELKQLVALIRIHGNNSSKISEFMESKT